MVQMKLAKFSIKQITIFEQLNVGSSLAFRDRPYNGPDDAAAAAISLRTHLHAYVVFVMFCIILSSSAK